MPLRIGMIGLGYVAQKTHIPAFAKIDSDRAVLAAVCDLDGDVVKETAGRIGAEAYTDTNEMLDRAHLDGVIIGIPPHVHGDLEGRLIERQMPFLMEKPAHRDIDRAIEIAEKIKAEGLVAGVAYLDRYQSNVAVMKEHLAEDPAGAFAGYWIGGIYTVPWWIKKAQSGGQHFEQTTHTFDMARYLFGEVVEVTARGCRQLLNTDVEGYEIEDASASTLVFESGLVGTIFSACFQRSGNKRRGLDIYTRGAHVEFHNRETLFIHKGRETVEHPNTVYTAQAEDEAFLEAIATNDIGKMLSPYPDGVKSLALSEATGEAMATGQPVRPRY